MKKKFIQFMLLTGLFASSGIVAQAQTTEQLIEAAMKTSIDSWSFSSGYVTVDGLRYQLDETHGLARFASFSNSDKAPEVLTIPSTISYNEKTYVVVATYCPSSYSQRKTTGVTLPNTIRLIGENSLGVYDNVKTFNIPASVEKIEVRAFSGMTNKTIKFAGKKAPLVTGDLNGTSTNNHLKLIVPGESFTDYNITDYIEDQCVISSDVEKATVRTGKVDNGELGYIIVSDVLPVIRRYNDVNKLVIESGTIDESDWHTIRDLSNLIELDLSGLSITEIPTEALYNCWQIEKVILPECLTTIRGYAFYGTGIKDIVIPEAVANVTGSYNFSRCDSLQSISFPDAIKSLPSSVCYDCSNLHNLKLPAQLETMGSNAFMYCDLYELYIPGSLTTIPSEAFRINPNLRMVWFGLGVQTIGSYAFNGCTLLGAAPDNPQYADYEVTLPSSVRTINGYAFAGCSSFKRFNLNEGLETIENKAFNNCTSLDSINLPSSLLYCTNSPFSGCTNLMAIRACSLLPATVKNDIPTGSAGNRRLWVPLWSFQQYMTTPGWLEYQSHTAIDYSILPENIYVNKEFEFVLKESENHKNYAPNIRMLWNEDRIDDGFGDTKYERGNLIVSSRSTLNVNDFSMFVSPYAKYYADFSYFYYGKDYEYYETMYNPNSLVVRGNMRAENQTINLMVYKDIWQFISFPFDVRVGDIVPADSKTQWAVRKYDGAARAAQDFDNTWVNLSADDVLEAGKGYILKCYLKSDYDLVHFTVTPIVNSVNRQRLFTSEDVKVALEENLSELEQNRSWNLVGNPYPSFFDTRYLDTEAPFLVWNSYNKKYEALSPIDDKYVLTPGEAFFIQRPVNEEELVFLNGGRQTYRNPNDLTVTEIKGRRARSTAKREVINLTLAVDELTDRTRVVFNEDAEKKYEVSRDAAKFMAEDAMVPQIWTVEGKSQLAINERPADNGVVALTVRCGYKGMYTINVSKDCQSKVTLEDRQTGLSVVLDGDKGYTFNANAGVIEGRFFINIAEAEATAIEGITSESDNNAPAFNTAGQRVNSNAKGIVIKNGKKVYNK